MRPDQVTIGVMWDALIEQAMVQFVTPRAKCWKKLNIFKECTSGIIFIDEPKKYEMNSLLNWINVNWILFKNKRDLETNVVCKNVIFLKTVCKL